jgi:uncharacterized membrane protein (DUF4010 family)
MLPYSPAQNSLADTLFGLGLALALGLLVGVERGWEEREAPEGSRVAGIRTFGLIALLGGLWELLGRGSAEILLGISFLAFVMLMIIAHVAEARVSKDYGVTTLVAALITFALGSLAVRGDRAVAATGAVVTAVVLSLKPVLHRWLQQIEREELTAALKLLLISVVILPVLPDQGYGPWQALNPYELWWLVVLIATISFAAYCAVKIAGAKRGILLTGFLGGLVSSTAVSIHLARLAAAGKHKILAAGILVASATMFVRVLFVTAILNPALSRSLSLPMIAIALWLFGAAAVNARKSEQTVIDPFKLRNPVELGQALQFGLLLAAIVLAAKAAQAWFGDAGILFLAVISGVADVDAITVTLSRWAVSDASIRSAAIAVLAAAMVNTVTKAVLTAVIGGHGIGSRVAWPLGISLLVGAVAAWKFIY